MPNLAEQSSQLHTRRKKLQWLFAAQILLILAAVWLLLSLDRITNETRWLLVAGLLLLLASGILGLLLYRRNNAALSAIAAAKATERELFIAPVAGFATLTISVLASLITGTVSIGTGAFLHINHQTKHYMAVPSYVTYLKDNQHSVDDRVRYAISVEHGNDPPDISKCPPDKDMSDLIGDDDSFLDLTGLFNIIVNANPHTGVCSAYDVKSAPKVKDCITLVKSKITH